jgi:integrase
LTFIPDCLKQAEGSGNVFGYSCLPRFLERKVASLKQKVWSWHNLRHRRASIWASEGKDVFWIQQMLGHQNITITMRYLQLLSRRKSGERNNGNTAKTGKAGQTVETRFPNIPEYIA